MDFVLLETKNGLNGKALRLMKEVDGEHYQILKGVLTGEHGRWEVKGTYDDQNTAIGVYLFHLPRLLEDR